MEPEILIIFVILFISGIAQISFWIWGICSIESAIRDDLKRYKTELTLEQLNKALIFINNIQNKEK